MNARPAGPGGDEDCMGNVKGIPPGVVQRMSSPTVNGQAISAGHALLMEGEKRITLSGDADAEVLVFDLAH